MSDVGSSQSGARGNRWYYFLPFALWSLVPVFGIVADQQRYGQRDYGVMRFFLGSGFVTFLPLYVFVRYRKRLSKWWLLGIPFACVNVVLYLVMLFLPVDTTSDGDLEGKGN